MNTQTQEALKMAKQHIIERKGGRGGAVCYVKSDEEVIKAIDEALAQPTQEPVAWMYQVNQIYTQFSDIEPSYDEYDEWSLTPLYTHPATWQSLSDNNILNLFKPKFQCEIEDFELIDFARAIEQALKELNVKK